ncbi:MAG: bifunctional D-glycero-beta-D-manno-heptose-7-phosphate kinase/D-glycero-beta-D-manno-heptose 1-phosphate adenylyltransferase HldE [Gammaproteobacteria bacterium]
MYKYFQPSATARILVVGDVILDRYVYGDTTRISPEAPVPVVKVRSTRDRPGGAANVALNIGALGVTVQLIGITGEDENAEVLSGQLNDAGVQSRFVRQPGFPTITKLRVLSRHQQLLRLDYEADSVSADSNALQQLYIDELEQADAVILSDYAKGSLHATNALIDLARNSDIRVLVDPKGDDFSRYRHASLLTPNLTEFETIVGACRNQDDLVEKGRSLCQELALEALCITRGEQGMTLIDRQQDNVVHLPAQAREVFDVTGAGDTVIATLAAAMVSGYGLEEALLFANRAAGLVVEKLGAAPVSVRELNTSPENPLTATSAVVGREELIRAVAAARDRGETIAMTNGCFDLLHAGHVHYLTEAGCCADRLIVAVNDDACVKRLKGRGRPINPLPQRMAVLAGLAAVDWVTAFSEDTPEALVKLVKPDVLVKGGDYRPEQIAGAEYVRQNGGKVEVIPFKDDSSTSSIIRTIRNSE